MAEISVYRNIGYIALIALLYIIIVPITSHIFTTNYYSVRDIIYSHDKQKGNKALKLRIVIITIFCWLCKLVDLSTINVILGITFGSFLCTWPSIYTYQLYRIWEKGKFLYLVGCLVSISVSASVAWLSSSVLVPMLYGEVTQIDIIFTNSAATFLWPIFSEVFREGLRNKFRNEKTDNPYILDVRLYTDCAITKQKFSYEEKFIKMYNFEIERSAQKYDLSTETLKTVLLLEKINRADCLNNILEHIACRCLPTIVIKRNCTLGVAQVSVNNAQDYFQQAPRYYLLKMLDKATSIDLCAFMLRKICDSFSEYMNESELDDNIVFENDYKRLEWKLAYHIACEYLTGNNDSKTNFALVYAALLYETYPYYCIDKGNG